MNELNQTITDDTKALIKANVAPTTIKTYHHAIQQFEIWLDGCSPSDSRLANYITGLHQDGKAPATISKIVAAVKWGAKNHGVGASDFAFEITEKTFAGIRREGKSRGRGQVAGITWDVVEEVCALAEADNTVAGLRDAALIRLMSDCLLRISEAVAVDVADVSSVLTIQQSKGTLEEVGAMLYVGVPTREVIKQYCKAGTITDGPLFRRIRRGDNITDSRLSTEGARHIIKRRTREAGVEGFISGHSLRVGSAVSLAQAGASIVDLQVAGRWKSSEMPVHYAKAELAEQGGIARFKYEE